MKNKDYVHNFQIGYAIYFLLRGMLILNIKLIKIYISGLRICFYMRIMWPNNVKF